MVCTPAITGGSLDHRPGLRKQRPLPRGDSKGGFHPQGISLIRRLALSDSLPSTPIAPVRDPYRPRPAHQVPPRTENRHLPSVTPSPPPPALHPTFPQHDPP